MARGFHYLRTDGGICHHRILDWCDCNGVGYIVGLAKDKRLDGLAGQWMAAAQMCFEASGDKQRLFGELTYAAATWKTERRVIARIEQTAKGANQQKLTVKSSITPLHEISGLTATPTV